MTRLTVPLAAMTFAVSAAACTSGGADPTPSGATCPPASTLTYDNFGQPFMEAYCTRCHASTLHGNDRHGAPVFHDFDSLTGILNVHDHVDWYAAAGPSSVNEEMPFDGPMPTMEERFQLGEWLACEVSTRGL